MDRIPLGSSTTPWKPLHERPQNPSETDNYIQVKERVAVLLSYIDTLKGEVSMTVREWENVCNLRKSLDEFFREGSE